MPKIRDFLLNFLRTSFVRSFYPSNSPEYIDHFGAPLQMHQFLFLMIEFENRFRSKNISFEIIFCYQAIFFSSLSNHTFFFCGFFFFSEFFLFDVLKTFVPANHISFSSSLSLSVSVFNPVHVSNITM